MGEILSQPVKCWIVPDEWHFTLQNLNNSERLEVTEFEPGVVGERLELLAAVRGLEALDQPSHVILLTPSRYVGRGIRHGISCWRDSNWMWERFGQLVDVKDADLWRRIYQALRFHQVDCRSWAHSAFMGPEEEEMVRKPKRRFSLSSVWRSREKLLNASTTATAASA